MIKYKVFDMKITFSDEEIAEFPTEINEFLTSYVAKRLSRLDDVQPNQLKLVKETPLEDEPDQDEKLWGTVVTEGPRLSDANNYKYAHRELLTDKRFDWHGVFDHFLKIENRLDSSYGDHDFLWVLDGDSLRKHQLIR